MQSIPQHVRLRYKRVEHLGLYWSRTVSLVIWELTQALYLSPGELLKSPFKKRGGPGYFILIIVLKCCSFSALLFNFIHTRKLEQAKQRQNHLLLRHRQQNFHGYGMYDENDLNINELDILFNRAIFQQFFNYFHSSLLCLSYPPFTHLPFTKYIYTSLCTPSSFVLLHFFKSLYTQLDHTDI